jgi:hypothetical protein
MQDAQTWSKLSVSLGIGSTMAFLFLIEMRRARCGQFQSSGASASRNPCHRSAYPDVIMELHIPARGRTEPGSVARRVEHRGKAAIRLDMNLRLLSKLLVGRRPCCGLRA